LSFFVVLEIAFEPLDMAFALERQDVGGDRSRNQRSWADDHGASSAKSSSASSSARSVSDVEIVGGLVEQQHVGAGFQHLGQMHAGGVSPPDSAPTFFCWSAPLKLNDEQ